MTNDTDGTTDYAATVKTLSDEGWSDERILTGFGFPNLDRRPARRAVRKIKRGRHSPAQAVLGKRTAADMNFGRS